MSKHLCYRWDRASLFLFSEMPVCFYLPTPKAEGNLCCSQPLCQAEQAQPCHRRLPCAQLSPPLRSVSSSSLQGLRETQCQVECRGKQEECWGMLARNWPVMQTLAGFSGRNADQQEQIQRKIGGKKRPRFWAHMSDSTDLTNTSSSHLFSHKSRTSERCVRVARKWVGTAWTSTLIRRRSDVTGTAPDTETQVCT